MIELADKWTRQPQGVRRINRANPLVVGLTAVFEAQNGRFYDVLNPAQSPTVNIQSLKPTGVATALVGDGTNYIRYANNNARYGSVPPFTLAAYLVRRGTLTQYRRVLENGALRSPNTSGWDIDADASNGLVFIGWPATNISTTTGPLPLDTPTLLVWSVNASGVTTYVDGVQSSTNAASNYFSATDGAFSLLRILSDEHSPTANIDILSARIWANRALSAADVKSLYLNYWQIYDKRPKRVFVTAGGGGGVTGSAAITLGNDTSSATGTTTVKGTAAPTLGNATSSATGVVGSVSGTVAITLGNDTSSAQGTTSIGGTGAVILGNDTCSASGAVGSAITGTAAITLGNDTSSAQGTTKILGSAAITLGADFSTAQGTTKILGSAAITLGDDFATAFGTSGTPTTVSSPRGLTIRIGLAL